GARSDSRGSDGRTGDHPSAARRVRPGTSSNSSASASWYGILRRSVGLSLVAQQRLADAHHMALPESVRELKGTGRRDDDRGASLEVAHLISLCQRYVTREASASLMPQIERGSKKPETDSANEDRRHRHERDGRLRPNGIDFDDGALVPAE